MSRRGRLDDGSWIRGREQRREGGAPFPLPSQGARPGIRPVLRTTRKRVAARFFQLLSGHPLITPFLRDRWGWIETDRCWWCEEGRQSREHLFKECRSWGKEIKELWSTVGKISGKRSARDGVDIPFKSKKSFGFHVRQERGPAIPWSGSFCRTTDTQRRFWTSWVKPGWERLKKGLFVDKRQD